MRRREMLVGSGTVAAIALSGYTAANTDEITEGSKLALSSDFESILELVPADSALETSYLRVHYANVDGTEADDHDYQTQSILDDVAKIDDGVDRDAISDVLSVFAANGNIQLSVATGSFDQPEVDVDDVKTRDGWQIADLGNEEAFAAADGQLVVASTSEADPSDVVETAVETATGETNTILTSPEATKPTFERLESVAYVVFFPDLETVNYLEFDDKITSLGVGLDQPPTERSGTTEPEFVLELASDADVDDDWIIEQLQRVEQGEFIETTVNRDDAFVHVEAVVDQPPEYDREAAPDARVRARSNADEGVVTFEHTDGESIATDKLEVWVDGELADEQLADEYDSFTDGDSFELETGPIADVGLRWFDEADDVYYYYDTTLVGSESFESSYDPETDTVEITYVGELEADSDLFELVHQQGTRSPNQGSTNIERSSVEIASGSLTQGDTITVEDVTLDDRVTLELTSPANPNRGQQSLAHIHVRPPRMHLTRHEDTLVARYWGDQERDAADFRVLIDGEPGAVQFADQTETLKQNDEIELGEVSHGTSVTVEWLEPDTDDPVVIEETVLHPNAHIEFTYDHSEGEAVANHKEGDEIDADTLELRVDGEPATAQSLDEYETFAPGDDVSIAVDPLTMVELVWKGGEDTEHGLGRLVAGRESFSATYDHDAQEVEIVYTGEQPADPSGLEVDHTGSRTGSSDGEVLFSQEYDTLTEGDGVVIEDIAVTDQISVMLTRRGDNYASSQSIFWFTPEPRRAFTFKEREDGLVAVYRERTDRDADNFEFLVDGELAAVQPADHYETLTTGDEITLGDVDVGTELTIEWVVPEESREVTTHVVRPNAEFDIDYKPDDGEVTVEHTGGDEINADDLGVLLEPTSREPRGWDDYETVSKGDTTTVALTEDERDREPVAVVIIFKESTAISHKRIDR